MVCYKEIDSSPSYTSEWKRASQTHSYTGELQRLSPPVPLALLRLVGYVLPFNVYLEQRCFKIRRITLDLHQGS